ncbi:MAG: histidine--tRNA ligase [Dehalococcoidales bacterium]|nr:histidine--tRNA ligase [Dehalococcoidales bacterium]
MYQSPRGTTDILPDEQAYWRFLDQKIAAIGRIYGYRRIDTPLFEDAGLFVRGVGEETDIVQKEMYTFEDRGGSKLTLRPEGTASVCRAYVEHGMQNLPQPVKLYYSGPSFRYERPQAGRYRQFHQFGCEAIGEIDPSLDAEVIDMAWQFFLSLGMGQLHLVINSIGCKNCRPLYLERLKDFYSSRTGEICDDCRSRLDRNPLRLLDCKNPSCHQLAVNAPRSYEQVCEECAVHFEHLKQYLSVLSLPFEIDHCLVRGLDYYSRTVFEIQPELEGAQSTIGAGGRYDGLIEELGGKPTPAIGFAAGLERIILNLKRQNTAVPVIPEPEVFVAFLGEAARQTALKVAGDLRKKGIGVIQTLGSKSLKAQLRQANSLHVRYSIVIGEEEVKAGNAQVRDMINSQQQTVPFTDLEKTLKADPASGLPEGPY